MLYAREHHFRFDDARKRVVIDANGVTLTQEPVDDRFGNAVTSTVTLTHGELTDLYWTAKDEKPRFS